MKTPHAPKIPKHKGGKLLEVAQKEARATSGQNPGQFLPRGADNRDIIIERLQRQLVELTHIMVDNKLMRLTETVAPSQTEGRIMEPTLPPREGPGQVAIENSRECG